MSTMEVLIDNQYIMKFRDKLFETTNEQRDLVTLKKKKNIQGIPDLQKYSMMLHIVIPILNESLIQKNNMIQILSLKGSKLCRIDDCEFNALAEAIIMTNLPLQVLEVPNNHISSNSKESLAALLTTRTFSNSVLLNASMEKDENNNENVNVNNNNNSNYTSQLTRLDISGNLIDYKGIGSMCDALIYNDSLTSLDVSWNKLEVKGGYKLAETLESNTSIIDLNVNECDLSEAAFIAITTVLSRNNRIARLEIENARIISKECIADSHLSRLVERNRALKEAKFGKLNIDDFAMERLTGAFLSSRCISILSLRSNQITVTGAEAIATLILNVPSLKELDISGNRICCDGAKAIGLSIQENTTLKKLNLRKNSIEDDGLTALADGLKYNSTINEFRIWGNHFDQQSSERFDQLIKNRFKALKIFVDVKPYIVSGLYQVAEANRDTKNDNLRYQPPPY